MFLTGALKPPPPLLPPTPAVPRWSHYQSLVPSASAPSVLVREGLTGHHALFIELGDHLTKVRAAYLQLRPRRSPPLLRLQQNLLRTGSERLSGAATGQRARDVAALLLRARYRRHAPASTRRDTAVTQS